MTVKGINLQDMLLNQVRKQMVYKHAISTVTPARPLSIGFECDKKENGKA